MDNAGLDRPGDLPGGINYFESQAHAWIKMPLGGQADAAWRDIQDVSQNLIAGIDEYGSTRKSFAFAEKMNPNLLIVRGNNRLLGLKGQQILFFEVFFESASQRPFSGALVLGMNYFDQQGSRR